MRRPPVRLVGFQIRNPKSEIRSDRQGSVLIVVIGLLLLMMLIGFTFFTFTNQEHSAAEYYADSAKVFSVTPDVNALFDFASEQLIIGPREINQQSVLWPGWASLIPNELGMFAINANGTNLTTVPTDRHPYNGVGVHVAAGPQGQPWVDQNYNGVSDAAEGTNNSYLLTVNWSRGATVTLGTNLGLGGAPNRAQVFNLLPSLDAGYTYPDINSPFLAYVAPVPQSQVGAAGQFVLKPSFHFPQYLRSPFNGNPITDWQTNTSGGPFDTTNRVFCPHPGHVCVANTAFPRYLTNPVVISATHTIQPYVFAIDSNGNGTPGEAGVWYHAVGNVNFTSLDYPVDNDNDGIFDGVWLDLNFPWSTLQDGRVSVPLFSYLVVELDSLINLNASGNLTAFTQLAHPLTGSPLALMGANNTPISRSNLGVTPSEINPFWALVCEPRNSAYLNPPNTFGNPSPALQQYRAFYNQGNNPGNFVVDRVEAANMDMLFLLWGRPTYSVTSVGVTETYTLNNLAVGLWGEASSLLNGVNSGAPIDFPRPGQSGFDDNNDRFTGMQESDQLFLGGVSVPPFSHPLDLTGGGQWLTPGIGNGQLPHLAGIFPTTPQTWAPVLKYTGYQPQSNNPGFTYPTMRDQFGAALGLFQYQGITLAGSQPLSQNPYKLFNTPALIGTDEAAEVVTDRRYQKSTDQILPTDEIAAMHLAQPDYLSGLGQSRLRTIAALNFELNQQAATIRKRFTTESADRKQHSFAQSKKRPWEYGFDPNNPNNPGNDWDGTGGNQFPPRTFLASATNPPFTLAGQVPVNVNSVNWVGGTNTFAKAEPFRMELAALIGAKLNNMQFNAQGVAVINTSPYNLTTDPSTSAVAMTSWQQQFRLNINRVLTTTDPALAMGPTNPLRYRELTPHPQQGLGSAPISTTLNTAAKLAFPSPSTQAGQRTSFANNPALQEYWARRDRQMLARDIFVMLYMFGGGLDTEDRNGNGILDPGEDLNANNKIDNINYATFANTITGNDPQDLTGTLKLRQLYNDRQLREMAQFAVNLVDSLDRDDTISKFEYPTDLSNGWNLDDDPYTIDSVPGAGLRGEVFGVEAQQLAFSESLVAVSKKVKSYIFPNPPKDHPATLLDDSQRDRYFTWLELHNVYGYSVPLGNQNWQIAYVANTTPGPNDTSLDYNVLTLMDGNAPVGGGQAYTIGSRTYVAGSANEDIGPGKPQPSVLMVDPNWNRNTMQPNYQQIIPATNSVPATVSLDLVAQTGNNRFQLTSGPMNPITTPTGSVVPKGAFVDPGPDSSTISYPFTFTFILRRQVNLNRASSSAPIGSAQYITETADNPFIEVDRMTFMVQGPPPADVAGTASTVPPPPGASVFNLRDPSDTGLNGGMGDMVAAWDIQPKLERLTSRERVQPLDGNESLANPTTTLKYSSQATIYANTLGNVNQASRQYLPQGFNLWQPHFDRDFASIGELLSVPLYAPWYVTQKLSAPPVSTPFIGQMVAEYPTPPTVQILYPNYEARLAQAKFVRPQHPSNIGNPKPAGISTQYDNRWHRLLELVEVPTRENIQVENDLQSTYTWLYPQALQRVPAKMNVNGTRYGETFHALADDPNIFDPFQYNPDGSYNDRLEAGNRSWWFEFIAGRDGIGTNSQPDQVGGLYLPGAPGTQPFRSYSNVERNPINYTTLPAGTNPPSSFPGPNSADDTLLRSMTQLEPVDSRPGQPLEQRHLFEARAQADLVTQNGNNTIDPYTRNRILSKIAGNTTTRSNVFAVWMTVGFFEGYRPDPVNNPNVVQIGAEMTDQTRRRRFMVVDRSLLEDAWNPATGTYDFHKFIQYQKTIQ